MSNGIGYKPTVLFVLGNLLGGSTFNRRVIEAINNNGDITPHYLYIDDIDYKEYPAPAFIQHTRIFESAWVTKKKYMATIKMPFDIIFFQGCTLPLFFGELVKYLPTAVAMDTTTIGAHQINILQHNSISTKIKATINSFVSTFSLKRIYKDVDIFLPRTQWCANSLISDFNVQPDRICVTLPPLDLSKWKPDSAKKKIDRVKILFIGNDFRLKGGELLLRIYERYLADRSILRIVSNDKYLSNKVWPQGVEIISGLTHDNENGLIQVYKSSDLFVFPTMADKLGIVLSEAIATGLPVIARDVGGVGELVKDKFNGYLMPYHSTEGEWASKIYGLINDPDTLVSFGQKSRQLAEEKLSMADFNKKINRAIEILKRNLIDK